jgi:hypothetical protein
MNNHNNSHYFNEIIQRSYPPATIPKIESRFPFYHQYDSTTRKIEHLKQQGISIQSMILQSRKWTFLEEYK